MDKIRPLKHFGQNYLKDKNTLRKIASEISPQPGDHIVEIGPGTGALTELLYSDSIDLTAVEIDTRVVDDLKLRFPGIRVLREDFLKTDLKSLYDINLKRLRIAGNIPYNITSPIVFKILENSSLISDAVLLVQHEVALRMSGEKGTKDYGIFTVILKYFTEVSYCFKISPNVFYPKPKVSSAVVHIRIKKTFVPETDEMFIKIVKAAFGKRRKTLKNSLRSSIFAEFNFEHSGVDLTKRAEQLDLDDFIKLSEFVLQTSAKSPNILI